MEGTRQRVRGVTTRSKRAHMQVCGPATDTEIRAMPELSVVLSREFIRSTAWLEEWCTLFTPDGTLAQRNSTLGGKRGKNAPNDF